MILDMTTHQKIHIRNVFKIFIPLRGDSSDFRVKLNTTPVFGVLVYNKHDPSISYDYQVQMLALERSFTLGIEFESDVAGCFSWAKRNAVLFQTAKGTSTLSGIVLRLKVNHGVFDFRKGCNQLVRFVVNLHTEDRFMRQGTSAQCQVLPKKRKAERSKQRTEDITAYLLLVITIFSVEIAISWPEEETSVYNQQNPASAQSHINMDAQLSIDDASPLEVYESPEVSQIRMPNLFEQSHSTQELELSNISSMSYIDTKYQLIESSRSSPENEQYMVLYNGNAEVIGNFRALNFYKASDINIKEDIRLLVEDKDPRDVILRIDGVEYKFKDHIQHATNKRFVGYIAQQIESVVPEAVQLIDGILHVDYESLIPYLSESIKRNYNDILDLKSDSERLETLLNRLYDQFTKSVSNVKSRSDAKSKTRSDQQKNSANAISQLVRTKWQWFAGIFLLALIGLTVALSVGLGHPKINDGTEPTPENPEIYSKSVARIVLEALYESTNGNYWKDTTNWMSDRSVCEWYGVTCEIPYEYEHVTEIRLSNNNLTGSLIGLDIMYKLVQLKVLDLSKNGILLSIPQLPEFITHLNLSENKLSIDIKLFNQYKFIESLNLGYTWTSGEFQLTSSQLFRLKELNVSHSYITSVGQINGEYQIEVCDWSGVTLGCQPVPDWLRKCGAKCL